MDEYNAIEHVDHSYGVTTPETKQKKNKAQSPVATYRGHENAITAIGPLKSSFIPLLCLIYKTKSSRQVATHLCVPETTARLRIAPHSRREAQLLYGVALCV